MAINKANSKDFCIITAVGYYYTGSGIIEDLCREFDNCEVLSDYEVRFLQDPDGISDLQYNLVDNNHRHNTGFAIKRFLRYAKFLDGSVYSKRYQKIFGDQFWNITMEYVDSITQLKSKTWWHGDQLQKGKLFYFLDILFGKITVKVVKQRRSLLEGREYGYYTYLTKNEFLEKTKIYMRELFSVARKTDRTYLFVNQLVSPSNVDRYMDYFDSIKVVVVDRDPRDLYIACREHTGEGVIPVNNVEDFCIWYRTTRAHREHEQYDHSRCLFVSMEDLITNYDVSIKSVVEFLGLDERCHTAPKKYFDPSVSVNGTRLVGKYPQYKKDVQFIEDNLPEYLYRW